MVNVLKEYSIYYILLLFINSISLLDAQKPV